MYMSGTGEAVKDKIFFLGVDCPDVQRVVSFGLPRDIESYIQETGQAGHDNLHSLAVLIRKRQVEDSR